MNRQPLSMAMLVRATGRLGGLRPTGRVQLLLWVMFALQVSADDATVDFATDVAPIFQEHCVRCHLPGNKKGDLSLATLEDLQTNDHVMADKRLVSDHAQGR